MPWQGYLGKALLALDGGRAEFEAGRVDNCANRAYYACFLAAVAALEFEGVSKAGKQWGHGEVQAKFHGMVIRQRHYPEALRGILNRTRVLRETADYGPEPASKRDMQRALADAERFVKAVEDRLGGNRWQ